MCEFCANVSHEKKKKNTIHMLLEQIRINYNSLIPIPPSFPRTQPRLGTLYLHTYELSKPYSLEFDTNLQQMFRRDWYIELRFTISLKNYQFRNLINVRLRKLGCKYITSYYCLTILFHTVKSLDLCVGFNWLNHQRSLYMITYKYTYDDVNRENLDPSSIGLLGLSTFLS